MERAGTTGVDAAVPMVESSARLACDGEDDDDDDDKSWYDTYNMTGDGKKKKKKKREAKEREREERDTPTGTVLFDQLIRQTVRQSAVQIVMPYLTLPYLYLPYPHIYYHAITRYYLLSVSSRLQCGGVYILDTLSFQHVRVRYLVRRSYGHPTDKTDYTLCKTNVELI